MQYMYRNTGLVVTVPTQAILSDLSNPNRGIDKSVTLLDSNQIYAIIEYNNF